MTYPKVILKAASTLDGKIATHQVQSKWITCQEARDAAHKLRHECDAILVGINTLLADNPRLNTRGIDQGRSPIRIVLDSEARAPLDSLFFSADGVDRIVIVGRDALGARTQLLTDLGAIVLQAPTPRPQIEWVLKQLYQHGVKRLLVEGGSQIHASFIASGFVDHLILFLSGKVFGGKSPLTWSGLLDFDDINMAPKFCIRAVEMVGEDLMLTTDFRGKEHDD